MKLITSLLRLARSLVLISAFIVFAHAAFAAEVTNLYQGAAIVTGTVKENRPGGFASALEDVLIKLAADPAIAADKRVAALKARAGTLVMRHRYFDLLTGLPTHDEQGTRDRPYELIVDFDPAKIDAALKSLGREPWSASRPRLAVFLAMRTMASNFVLAADGDRDLELESIGLAAKRRGMPIAVPDKASAAATGLSFENWSDADIAKLESAAKALGGDAALVGRLTWLPDTSNWRAEWKLSAGGKTARWQEQIDTYDNAFRNAFATSAMILSGRGAP
jgi:hypothetical protein